MMILQQKKVILVKYETSRRNPDLNLVIYLAADKVEQYRLVAENRIEKEEDKRQITNNTTTLKLHHQQK